MWFIFNINDFFPLPFSNIIFPPMNDIRAERCATKSVRTVRIMMKFYLKRDQPILTEIETLNRFPFLKIPKMQLTPIFEISNFFQIKTRHKRIWRCPFRTNHHIMARLVPKIIAKFNISHGIFPTANNFEILV